MRRVWFAVGRGTGGAVSALVSVLFGGAFVSTLRALWRDWVALAMEQKFMQVNVGGGLRTGRFSVATCNSH